MGRTHIQTLLGFGIHPTIDSTPARKNQRMRAVLVEDRQFEIATEWRIGCRLPHLVKLRALAIPALIYIRIRGIDTRESSAPTLRQTALI